MLADVKFQFKNEKIILAHSFVLCLQSLQFYNNFKYSIGVMKIIEVNDVSSDAFEEFIKYIYTKEIKVQPNHVYDLMKLSIQYDVEKLKEICEDFINSTVDIDTACEVIEFAIKEKWNEVKEPTNEFIANNFLSILNNDSFLETNAATLKTILELNPVSDNNEYLVFESVLKWVKRACEKDGIEPNKKRMRKKLDGNIKLIRFASMSHEVFAKCVENAPEL